MKERASFPKKKKKKKEEERKRRQENFKNGDGEALLKGALNSELSPCLTQTLIP
jgi:hypothetical protein